MNLKNTCLVITGCINPDSNVPVLALKDSNERKKQYYKSIRFYIEKTNFKNIVFCDNSDSPINQDIIDLAKDNHKNFEWLTFQGNTKLAIEKGKGYGEVEIINYVIKNSRLAAPCEYIFKITGRLIISNIDWVKIISSDGSNYFLVKDNNFVDTRCYYVRTVDFIKYFSQAGCLVDDTRELYLEHIFYKILASGNIDYREFPIHLEIVGTSGSTGHIYRSNRVKTIIKTILLLIRNR